MRFSFLAAVLVAFGMPAARMVSAPIPIPVLVITTYETGNDRGDVPGELQFWAERQDLARSIAVPGLEHPLLTNDRGLYAMVCGTTSRCAVQIMALGADPRFDLTHTYFLLSGIAGGDPREMSLGSAVWVATVVDGDPAFEIDSREMPAGWPYGLVAFGATEPGKGSADVDAVPAAGAADFGAGGIGTVAFRLNRSLVDWAYRLSRHVALDDDPKMRAFERRFAAWPAALQPPGVIIGVSMGADRFFHGALMTKWAEDWVRIYTRGRSQLTICDCEDQGVCLAIRELSRMGKADFNRLLILRTACNFVVPPAGVSAADSLFNETISDSAGVAYLPALEADYRVGSVVTAELLAHWERYRGEVP